MLQFLDLPHDLQYDILRRASVLQYFYYTRESKKIRHSGRFNCFYHTRVIRNEFSGCGLPVFNGNFIFFTANQDLIAKLEELTAEHMQHNHALRFFLKTPRQWRDMPPLTRRFLGESAVLQVFNVILPKHYQHWIFEDIWIIDTLPVRPSAFEHPDDPEFTIDEIIDRMRLNGLVQNRMLVNNLLVDFFHRYNLSFESVRHVTDDAAVVYLAWIMWWYGNWFWDIRCNEYEALARLYSDLTVHEIRQKINKTDLIGRLMVGLTS